MQNVKQTKVLSYKNMPYQQKYRHACRTSMKNYSWKAALSIDLCRNRPAVRQFCIGKGHSEKVYIEAVASKSSIPWLQSNVPNNSLLWRSFCA